MTSEDAPPSSVPIPPELPFRAGDVFAGKFRIERFIGQGSMAMVVEATHLGLDERVALKFLRRDSLAQPEVVSRFAREARAAVRIKNDHVARVFDVGVGEDQTPFIVMEYLSGSDLATLLERRHHLEPTQAADFIIQACEGIAEAHARGIVHRDVKPENLFLAQGAGAIEQIKVLDFGISKAALGAADLELASQHTTQIMGSPHYMSPEQLRSTRDVDARADVWSLGVVLYELVGGDTPFTATEVTSLIAQILHDPHRPIGVLVPGVPEGLAAVIDRCLAKDAAARYQTAAELAVALLPFAPKRARSSVERAVDIGRSGGTPSVDPDSVPPPPMMPRLSAPVSETTIGAAIAIDSSPPPRRRGLLVPVLAILVLLFGTALVVFAIRSGDRAPTAVPAGTASAATTTTSATPVAQTPPTATADPSSTGSAAGVAGASGSAGSAGSAAATGGLARPVATAPSPGSPGSPGSPAALGRGWKPSAPAPVSAKPSSAAPAKAPDTEIRMER